MSKATHELISIAKGIPSYGVKTFVVKVTDVQSPKINRLENQNNYKLGNMIFNVTFDMMNKNFMKTNKTTSPKV